MSETKIESNNETYSSLDLIKEEINKIKNKLPEDFDPIAKIMALSRPVIEMTLMNCGDWRDEREKTGRGRMPFSHITLMIIHIFDKLLNINNYRQMEREINAHPNWLKALNITKAPAHSTLSLFRTNMGEGFFKNFFYCLTELLNKLNLIMGNGVIVDSAPILASMNFARANRSPEINFKRVEDFFKSIDITPATRLINKGRKSKYNVESFINFFLFEKLGGFLSRSQALKFLKENPKVAELLGFKNGGIPTQPSFYIFENKYGSASILLKPLVDVVTDYFDNSDAIRDEYDIDFFFWSI